MNIINCTRRKVRLKGIHEWVELPSSEHPVEIRIIQRGSTPLEAAPGEIPLCVNEVVVKNLPPPIPDVIYIVPWEVVMFCKHRVDLVAVNGIRAERDKEGNLLGYNGVQRLEGENEEWN